MSISESTVVLVIVIGSAAFWGAAALAWGVWFIKGPRSRPRHMSGDAGRTQPEGECVNELPIPGPDGPANDNWGKRPDADVAPRRRINEDPRKLQTHE